MIDEELVNRLMLTCAEVSAQFGRLSDVAVAEIAEGYWEQEGPLSPVGELFATVIERLERARGGPMGAQSGAERPELPPDEKAAIAQMRERMSGLAQDQLQYLAAAKAQLAGLDPRKWRPTTPGEMKALEMFAKRVPAPELDPRKFFDADAVGEHAVFYRRAERIADDAASTIYAALLRGEKVGVDDLRRWLTQAMRVAWMEAFITGGAAATKLAPRESRDGSA